MSYKSTYKMHIHVLIPNCLLFDLKNAYTSAYYMLNICIPGTYEYAPRNDLCASNTVAYVSI